MTNNLNNQVEQRLDMCEENKLFIDFIDKKVKGYCKAKDFQKKGAEAS